MDIVHLMETNTEPLGERVSHSYAEMEQTITLDHSEGQMVWSNCAWVWDEHELGGLWACVVLGIVDMGYVWWAYILGCVNMHERSVLCGVCRPVLGYMDWRCFLV